VSWGGHLDAPVVHPRPAQDDRRLNGEAPQGQRWRHALGAKYRAFHEKVWAQIPGLLVGPRLFLLNIKDHVRHRERQPVAAWHVSTLESFGFKVIERREVGTGGLSHGPNRERFPDILVLIQYQMYIQAQSFT
jgi:hypothetical protein